LSWFKNFFGIFTRGSDKCNDLENEEYKQLCYSCEEQNTTEEKDACYISLVLATTETSFCDKISDSNKEKERCYTFVSREGEKVECDKIKSLGEKDNCYLQLILGGKNNDKEFCKRINDSVIKGRCYEYLALNLGYDANICNEIDNNDIKNRCLAKCTKNELLCKNIIDKFISAECYWDLANLKNSPELCENVDNTPDPEIKGGKSLRDMCYVYTRK
jgi:hypothetical protein